MLSTALKLLVKPQLLRPEGERAADSGLPVAAAAAGCGCWAHVLVRSKKEDTGSRNASIHVACAKPETDA